MAKRIAGHARRSRSSRPAASPRAEQARRWWKRTTAAILSLGALAGAITAIVSLRPSPDPEDSASFTAIRVTPQVPFSEYVQRLERSVPQKFGRGLAAAQTDSAVTTTRPRTSPPATPTITRPTGTPKPTSPATSPSNGSPALSAFATIVLPSKTNNAVVNTIIGEVHNRNPTLCGSSGSGGCKQVLRTIGIGSSVDTEGNPVPPEKAAEKVLTVLKDARVTTASREPVGAIVSVDVELAGLRGKPVELTWSMWQSAGETRLHGDWLNRNLAYRLEAGTDRDTTTVDLWVPLPPVTGPYFVRVDLAAKGSPLASAASEPFD